MINPILIRRQRIIICLLILLILSTIIVSMGLGYSSLTYDRILPIIMGHGSFKENFVLYQIRLPRIMVTVLTGILLSLSGAILQGVTRNDLADPGVIGINAGAGAAITIFYLLVPIQAILFSFLLPIVAFAGALLTACFIYLLSYRKNKGIQTIRLILIGIGTSMALSGFMIVLISSADRIKVEFIYKWLTGDIWGTDWIYVVALLPWLIFLIPFVFYKANRLNILSLSEPVALGVGLSIEKERRQLLFAAVALGACAVSITGGISFVGLIAPHISKALVGPRNQLFLPVALLLGGWLLLLADTIGNHMIQPNGIPAGVMISLIGAPYFIFLLIKNK